MEYALSVWTRYQAMKAEFIARNPNATPAEIEAAARRFAELLGI